MNYRGCMVLLASVLLSGGCVGSRPAVEVATEAKKPIDELYLKGIAAEENADYATAVKSLLEALDLLEKQPAPDKNTLARAYEALSSAYLNLQNDTEAEKYGLKALALKKELHGERHFEVSYTECLLGIIYTRLNKRDAALQHYSHARAIIEQNPEVVEASRRIQLYRQLAELYFFTNRQTEFEESLRMLVSLCKANPAHAHNLNELYAKLALTSEIYGKADQAEKYYLELERLLLEWLEDASVKKTGNQIADNLVSTTGMITHFYQSQKNSEKALEYARKLVLRCEKYLNEDDGSAITAYVNYANMILADDAAVPDDVMRSFLPKIKKQADKGNPDALLAMGLWYSRGGVFQKEPDEKTSKEYFLKAAEQGHSGAQCVLGWCYAHGYGVAKDMSEAMKWWRKAADQGYAEAQCNLGLAYLNGEGVATDKAEAVKWWRKAVEQGHAIAQYNLGWCYANGQGVKQDYAEAVTWWRKAAEQGHAEAQYGLGLCYANGLGIATDKAEAVKWYRRAAEQGNADAQYDLGIAYPNGLGIAKDISEAVMWWHKAADAGYAKAQYNLGCYYANGLGVAKDMSEAVKWCRKAAEQGDAKAQYHLGWCYANGLGIAKDISEAVMWWHKAAEQGNAWAQYDLGCCYANGQGVKQDYTEAVKWCRKAAEQGYAKAQYNLGWCYANGEGVAKNISEAVKWYRKAAEQGDENAQKALNSLEK